ncbi:MAG: energy transducer TonB [Brevundimonas sp.]|uniref:energy transducer TonB n=1 Tax=Brevundimonas sp. TaxID=1871086 RepID=UPI00391D8E04
MEIRTLFTPDRLRKAGAFAVVLIAHAGVFALIARTEPGPPLVLPPVIEVELFRPSPPPPPPPPPEEPSEDPGGGAPAAPSRIHVPPPPREPIPPEVPAPREQAPEPTLVVGVAPIASPTPGMGQGGQGTGAGSGIGAGDGPGRGTRTGPQNLRRPAMQDLRRYHPREALARGVTGVVELRCRIARDSRLEQCTVLRATPGGQGFAEAGLAAARDLYRFRPATLNGAYDDSVTVTVVLEFGRS